MKLNKYIFLSLFLLLCSCNDSSINPLDREGSISGTVYDFETDVTLADCTVTLFPTVGSDRTNSFGNFSFHSIKVEEYTIKVEKVGYRAYEGKVLVFEDETSKLSIALKKEKVYN